MKKLIIIFPGCDCGNIDYDRYGVEYLNINRFMFFEPNQNQLMANPLYPKNLINRLYTSNNDDSIDLVFIEYRKGLLEILDKFKLKNYVVVAPSKGRKYEMIDLYKKSQKYKDLIPQTSLEWDDMMHEIQFNSNSKNILLTKKVYFSESTLKSLLNC